MQRAGDKQTEHLSYSAAIRRNPGLEDVVDELGGIYLSLIYPSYNAKWVKPKPGACPCRCGGTLGECALPNRAPSGIVITPEGQLQNNTASVEKIYRLIETNLRNGLSPPRCLTREIRPPTPELNDAGALICPTDETVFTPGPTPLREDKIYDEDSPGYQIRRRRYGTPKEMRIQRREAKKQALAAKENGEVTAQGTKRKPIGLKRRRVWHTTYGKWRYREAIGTRSQQLIWHEALRFEGKDTVSTMIMPSKR